MTALYHFDRGDGSRAASPVNRERHQAMRRIDVDEVLYRHDVQDGVVAISADTAGQAHIRCRWHEPTFLEQAAALLK